LGNTFGDGVSKIEGFVGRNMRQRDGENERVSEIRGRETRVN